MVVLYSVGDKVKLQKIVQMAWTFVNDRYNKTACVFVTCVCVHVRTRTI